MRRDRPFSSEYTRYSHINSMIHSKSVVVLLSQIVFLLEALYNQKSRLHLEYFQFCEVLDSFRQQVQNTRVDIVTPNMYIWFLDDTLLTFFARGP
ncbi:hypothetical protein BCR42DRAFT_403496 [Absidia repens]|uniref:Uncharacterized protein n=1 Tax=Absidia repens TaxID=90262 RepID=A0A1X2IZE4_9FUNG|nr:hypothetical protein BCR42DRAFT_403496 [Absidia repens]